MARKAKPTITEYDSVYVLKIILYLVLGTTWASISGNKVLPIGLIVGLIIVQHEKLRIDRKIEYAVLVVAALLGLVGIGVTIAL